METIKRIESAIELLKADCTYVALTRFIPKDEVLALNLKLEPLQDDDFNHEYSKTFINSFCDDTFYGEIYLPFNDELYMEFNVVG
jgi:hypothetical protein